MTKYQIFLLFIFNFVIVSAQQKFNISGTIVNSNNNNWNTPVDVYLYDNENQLIKTTVTKDSKFEFTDLISNTYYLQISSGETEQKEKPFLLNRNINFNIIYQPKIKEIEAVTIIGEKKKFSVENGNITLDITDSPLNKVATSSELLTKLPFVTLDANDEGVSVVGKGSPLLYVDNQRVDFSTLSGISVEDIKSVEIIRNPSVKYESEGKAVIKINLKKSKRDGSKLALSETATFQKRFSNYFNANFQQKKNKTEWKINAAFNAVQHWESNGYNYAVPSKNISSDYTIVSITNRPQTIFGASLYQELNDDGDYLTLTFNSNFRPDKGDNNTNTKYIENGISSNILTLNHQDNKRASINSIFNYNKKLADWDANIFTGFQYTRESRNVDYEFLNNIDDSGYEFSQFRRQLYAGDVYSGRIDFEKKLKENYKLELGTSFTKAETTTDNIIDFATVKAPEFFNYFFKESNTGSYVNLSTEKNKWNFKAGIRMETTSAKGFDNILKDTTLSRNAVDWFPNAEISFQQDKDHVFTLNFRKTISRPGYGNLSSGGLYGSPYIEYVGNPNLIPTYTNTLSFNTSLKKWSVNASVYTSKNPMGYTLVYDDEKNISKFTLINFDKEIGASLGVDVPFEWKIWSSQNSMSVNYGKTEDSLALIKKSTPYLYIYTNNTLKITKSFSLLMDGSYISKRTEGLYENNAVCAVNFGITKSVSDFDFTFRYNDIFKQMNYIQNMTYDKIISTGNFYGNTPTISVAVKYNFGRLEKSSYKESSVNETSNRL
ncbi:outer membrane beta-barrel family protein [Chryseobacterium sp. CFS15]|uniref:outer membrane beta-barrel family protein n=1 Tax=Chryseobacterium sp. CFS15 TaxID=2986946 RepID=UPI0028079238|nr:outer membrane beta-barrel family protein [Chryseobacterium sp. CFS15]MDQ8143396.1 outer membrane beta-barrel family protein [Chryseobacterium sp. CFS15]